MKTTQPPGPLHDLTSATFYWSEPIRGQSRPRETPPLHGNFRNPLSPCDTDYDVTSMCLLGMSHVFMNQEEVERGEEPGQAGNLQRLNMAGAQSGDGFGEGKAGLEHLFCKVGMGSVRALGRLT